MNKLFNDNLLYHLSQLPYGTIIKINTDDIEVYKDSIDFEYDDYTHKFIETNTWIDICEEEE